MGEIPFNVTCTFTPHCVIIEKSFEAITHCLFNNNHEVASGVRVQEVIYRMETQL